MHAWVVLSIGAVVRGETRFLLPFTTFYSVGASFGQIKSAEKPGDFTVVQFTSVAVGITTCLLQLLCVSVISTCRLSSVCVLLTPSNDDIYTRVHVAVLGVRRGEGEMP